MTKLHFTHQAFLSSGGMPYLLSRMQLFFGFLTVFGVVWNNIRSKTRCLHPGKKSCYWEKSYWLQVVLPRWVMSVSPNPTNSLSLFADKWQEGMHIKHAFYPVWYTMSMSLSSLPHSLSLLYIYRAYFKQAHRINIHFIPFDIPCIPCLQRFCGLYITLLSRIHCFYFVVKAFLLTSIALL